MKCPRAFTRRDEFTCDMCENFRWRGCEPYCNHIMRVITWYPNRFGCGEYYTSEREDEMMKRRGF